ncbi:MAG TPA: hypothetical protein VKQ89_04860 [Candidatus Angelobacter sp.]|nr:hypothetical protein [Candidatus Angelobacter sp.]
MNAEPLRTALSKIAPLEHWDSSWVSYGPNICWELFRPKPKQLSQLWSVIREFEGHTRWQGVDGCLRAGVGLAAPPLGLGVSGFPLFAAPVRSPVNDAQATEDLTALAAKIEKQLGLLDVPVKAFSDALMTREGLRQSYGPFEDFVDCGQRNVYLIVNPAGPEVYKTTAQDIMLHFEPKDDEMLAICGDIVGLDLTKRDFYRMTEEEGKRVGNSFPLFCRITDYYCGTYVTPQEAPALYEESVALERIAVTPKAIRGVDKLMRIANWAVVKHCGVFFDDL